ncbi:MAG: RodZ domain-containing protein [Ignavibacteriaceae bacterium]
MLDKFADELREQREKSGISLQQLATKTRIDLKFLEAIEQGNFAFLPDLYVKAFVKQYAKTVGLDENLMIKKYDAAKEGKEYDPNQPEQSETNNDEPVKKEPTQEAVKKVTPPVKSYFENPLEKKSEEEKSNKQGMLLLIIGAAAIVVIALVYIFVFNKSDKIVVEETPIEEVIGQSSQRYEEEPVEQVASDSTVSGISTDSLHLTFFAKENSWVNVILDNNRVQEFTLYPNSKFTVSALNEFKVTVGNSGGVSMLLNNQPVNFSGRSGSVRHFKLDKTGLVFLNAPPKLEKQ